jgi:hypothetical protein
MKQQEFVKKHGWSLFDNTQYDGVDLAKVAAGYKLVDWGFPKEKWNAMIEDINKMYGTEFKLVKIRRNKQ